MTIIKEESKSQQLTVSLSLQYIEVVEGLCVFKQEVTSSSSDNSDLSPAIKNLIKGNDAVQEGICTVEALQNFLENKVGYIESANLQFASTKDLEDIRTKGWDITYTLNDKFKSKSLFEMAKDGTLNSGKFVKANHNCHMLFDHKGVVLPVAVVYGYLAGNMSNDQYDLEKAIPILKANPNVHFFIDSENRLGDEAASVQPIPYYNISDERDSQLCFVFSPSEEQAIAMWEKQQSYKGDYPSTKNRKAIFDLDLLGLQACALKPLNEMYHG